MLTQFFPDANAIFSHLIGGSIGNESLSPDVGRRRGSRRFDWVLLGFTGFYWVLRWKGRRSGRRLFQPDNYGEERIAPTIGRSEVTVSCRVFIGFCFFLSLPSFEKNFPARLPFCFSGLPPSRCHWFLSAGTIGACCNPLLVIGPPLANQYASPSLAHELSPASAFGALRSSECPMWREASSPSINALESTKTEV